MVHNDIVHNDLKENWLIFSENYLTIALLASMEMISKKYQKDAPALFNVSDLYLAAVYNTKHGIEVYLKSLIVTLEKNELIKKDQIHDNNEILKKVVDLLYKKVKHLPTILKKIAEENKRNNKHIDYWGSIEQSNDKFFETLLDLIARVEKFENLSFLKDKIGADFDIRDFNNTAFRHPQNSLEIKLNYVKILKKISNEDLKELHIDILKIYHAFSSLQLLLDTYFHLEKKKK